MWRRGAKRWYGRLRPYIYFLLAMHSEIKLEHVMDYFLPPPHKLNSFFSLKYVLDALNPSACYSIIAIG